MIIAFSLDISLWKDVVVLKGPSLWVNKLLNSLFGAGVLGDGLGSLRDGVLGQLTGQEETDSGLDLSAGDGWSPVVVGKTAGLGSDTLEDIVDKGVHDAHGLAGYTSVGVDLLQDLVDVDGVRFPPPPLLLLVPGTGGLCLGGGLLGSLRCSLGWHSEWLSNWMCEDAMEPVPYKWGRMQMSGLKTPSRVKLCHVDPDKENPCKTHLISIKLEFSTVKG